MRLFPIFGGIALNIEITCYLLLTEAKRKSISILTMLSIKKDYLEQNLIRILTVIVVILFKL